MGTFDGEVPQGGSDLDFVEFEVSAFAEGGRVFDESDELEELEELEDGKVGAKVVVDFDLLPPSVEAAGFADDPGKF